MAEKKYTVAGTDIDAVKKLNAAFGLSYNDSIALLAQASEVQTVDPIPLEPLRENLEIDSSTNKLNNIPDMINLDRNGPR
jgi:hypothetical protein